MSNAQSVLVTLEQVTVARAMKEYNPQILAAIDDRVLDPERFMRVAMTVIRRKPELEKCTLASILGAFVQCGQIGLYPDDIRGYVYLIPYYNMKKDDRGNDIGKAFEADLMVGYQGWIELFRQSGFAADDAVDGRVVWEQDKFDHAFEVKAGKRADWLFHKPSDAQDPGAMAYCYAVLNYRNGSSHFSVLSKKQAEKHRDEYAKTKKKSGPWFQEMTFPEMAIKTCIRKATKYAPSSPEMRTVAALEEMSEAGVDQKLDALVDLYDHGTKAMTVVPHPSSPPPQNSTSTGKMAQFMKEAELKGRDTNLEKTAGGAVVDTVTGEVVKEAPRAEGEPPPQGDLVRPPASASSTSNEVEKQEEPQPAPKVLSEEESREVDREAALKDAVSEAPKDPPEKKKATSKKKGGS